MSNLTLQQIKDEIAQMKCMRNLTSEEIYYILNESGFVEYIYNRCNGAANEQ